MREEGEVRVRKAVFVTLNHATLIKWHLKTALEPSKLNFFQKMSRVGYVCIEESFDTIFKIGWGWGGPHGLSVEKIGHGREG